MNALAGACLASSAIRLRFVETRSKFGDLVIFPSSGSVNRRSLPSTGSPETNSPASAVHWNVPTPLHPSCRTSLPSLGSTIGAPEFLSRRMPGAALAASGFGSSRFPSYGFDSEMEMKRSPGFPGNPHACMPRTSTPAKPPPPRPQGHGDAAFLRVTTEKESA